jgi:hypothetical protein
MVIKESVEDIFRKYVYSKWEYYFQLENVTSGRNIDINSDEIQQRYEMFREICQDIKNIVRKLGGK